MSDGRARKAQSRTLHTLGSRKTISALADVVLPAVEGQGESVGAGERGRLMTIAIRATRALVEKLPPDAPFDVAALSAAEAEPLAAYNDQIETTIKDLKGTRHLEGVSDAAPVSHPGHHAASLRSIKKPAAEELLVNNVRHILQRQDVDSQTKRIARVALATLNRLGPGARRRSPLVTQFDSDPQLILIHLGLLGDDEAVAHLLDVLDGVPPIRALRLVETGYQLWINGEDFGALTEATFRDLTKLAAHRKETPRVFLKVVEGGSGPKTISRREYGALRKKLNSLREGLADALVTSQSPVGVQLNVLPGNIRLD